MKLTLRKTDAETFTLPHEHDHEDDAMYKKMQKLKTGEVYVLTVTRPRVLKHHRKFMAILQYVNELYPTRFNNVEDVLDTAKILCGMGEIANVNGREVVRCRSIAFEAMGQSEFEKFYDQAISQLKHYGMLPSDFDEEEFTRGIQ